jgi:hypothetical protein
MQWSVEIFLSITNPKTREAALEAVEMGSAEIFWT